MTKPPRKKSSKGFRALVSEGLLPKTLFQQLAHLVFTRIQTEAQWKRRRRIIHSLDKNVEEMMKGCSPERYAELTEDSKRLQEEFDSLR